VALASSTAIHEQVAGLYHDDGLYAAVAKSLAEGGGYRIAGLPTNSAQTEYPFLYSLPHLETRSEIYGKLFLLTAFNVACLVSFSQLALFFTSERFKR
jgi:hypothetical protein